MWSEPASLLGMQHLSERPPVISAEIPSVPLRDVQASFSARLSAFVSSLRRELEETDLELLSAELRHVANAGPSWFLTIRRGLGSLEVLRAKVADDAPLDEATRRELRRRIVAHFAR